MVRRRLGEENLEYHTLQRTIFTIGYVENDMAKKDGPADFLGRKQS